MINIIKNINKWNINYIKERSYMYIYTYIK